ncbi:hypothetical protein E4T48_04471 [Aureobasidium sp. EXF-10727]|nr:hypothetical protein E4T48_04471 [Aureobasidium sp. EXF-10727]KAI4725443.1 hypothetical protein E4T49_06811 [Aureobasidium sp. EXF-10728]
MALVDLPPELLLRVATFLTTNEVGHFRLTSKSIEAVMFDSFAREFFTKKQFMLEQPSLQALIDISNHPTLAPRLSEVVISTHVLPPDPEIVTSTGKAMYEAGYVSHDVLMATGQALHMLSTAFSNLPNLRTVGLRDYNGLGRYRDGQSATWKSWGWSFGWDGLPTYDPDDRIGQRALMIMPPEPILPLLFYALGQAKVLPESVHVFLRKRAKLTQQSFNILDGYMGQRILPVLGDIKELMLAIGSERTGYTSLITALPTKPGVSTNAPLSRLLQCTPKLETLRLNFEQGQPAYSGFLNWLGSPVSNAQALSSGPVAGPVSLPRLTALELGMVTVPSAALLNVLTKFNLESFSLWKVQLHASSASEPEDCWQALLQDLAAALRNKTCLKSVLIGYPEQLHCGRSDIRQVCYFKPAGAGEEDASALMSEAKHHAGPGTSMADWLEELSKRTYVPPIDDDNSDSDLYDVDGEVEESYDDDADDDDNDDDDNGDDEADE